MTPGIKNRFTPAIPLLLTAALLVPTLAYAAADQDRVQFCWAMGKFDHTIYFAEVENREDRQNSFEQLLEVSGIDHLPVQCRVSDISSHRLMRTQLMRLA